MVQVIGRDDLPIGKHRMQECQLFMKYASVAGKCSALT